jgi:hypothetical protein
VKHGIVPSVCRDQNSTTWSDEDDVDAVRELLVDLEDLADEAVLP